MSDAVLAEIIGGAATIVASIVGANALFRSKRRKSGQSPTQQPAAKIEAPDAKSPWEVDATGYPAYLGISKLPTGPRVLLPYPTPVHVTREIAAIAPPLSRENFARDTFVGRWVGWKGVVFRVSNQHVYYNVEVHSALDRLEGLVILMFPVSRRAEVEVLNEGQVITYEGQILRASEYGVGLVHVDILPTA